MADCCHSPAAVQNPWLRGVRIVPSPNCNARPAASVVDLLVIHNISLPPGEFGSGHIDALFSNTLDCAAHPYFAGLRGLQVSAHFLIDRSGTVTQYVPLALRAWHAGVSQWEGRDNCNDYSVGIELEGTDTMPFTDAQYQALAGLTRVLQQQFPAITPARIVGHSDIAPARKTDPGPHFDWARFRASLVQAV